MFSHAAAVLQVKPKQISIHSVLAIYSLAVLIVSAYLTKMQVLPSPMAAALEKFADMHRLLCEHVAALWFVQEQRSAGISG